MFRIVVEVLELEYNSFIYDSDGESLVSKLCRGTILR